MLDRIKQTIVEHKIIFIALLLYIIIFIISIYLSPWQIENITFTDIDKKLSNADDMSLLNTKFMFYGIYEILEMLIYADSNNYPANAILFFITICSLFTYMHYLGEIIIQLIGVENQIEKVALVYIYDNIFSYLVCLLVYYLFNPIYNKISIIYNTSNSMFWQFVIVLLIIFIIIIPSLLQLLKIFSYIGVSIGIIKILETINITFADNQILCVILSFIVTAILILALNIIMEIIMNKLYAETLESTKIVSLEFMTITIELIKGILILGLFLILTVLIIFAIIYINMLINP